MFSVDYLPLQLILLTILILGTAVIAIHPWSRNLVAQIIQTGGRALRATSSFVAKIFDLMVPINPKNGRTPPVRWSVWCITNLGALAVRRATLVFSSGTERRSNHQCSIVTFELAVLGRRLLGVA
jgi:hypothetical protein